MQQRLALVMPEPEVIPVEGSLDLGSSTRGRIAELKAELHLLADGHKVAAPVIDDDGVDLIVDYQLTIQVKSTARKSPSRGSWRWHFEFRAGRKDGKRLATNEERLIKRSHVDFVLLYAHDADAWWVIPADALYDQGRVRITEDSAFDRRYREAWSLLMPGNGKLGGR